MRAVSRAILTVACLIACGVPASGQDARSWQADKLTQAGAELAWWFAIPKGMTTAISSYSLVDGYLYAIGTDGQVRALRADTGQYLWTTQVAPREDRIYPPVAVHSAQYNAAAFPYLNEVVLVDEASGAIVKRIQLQDPTSTSVAATPEAIYATSITRRVSYYSLATGFMKWQIRTHAPVLIPPLYVPSEGTVTAADEAGHVASAYGRSRQFSAQVDGRPQGWMAADKDALYIATGGLGGKLYSLDLVSGKNKREPYPLEGLPQGGPIVTANSVYQAVAPAGLHHIPLKPGSKHWFHKAARMFLAEWPDRVVVLRTDGKLQFVDSKSGEPSAPLEIGEFTQGVTNPWTDAVIVVNANAEIRCLRPANAKPLSLADFRPKVTATRPATKPAAPATAPAGEPGTVTEPIAPSEPATPAEPTPGAEAAPAEPPASEAAESPNQ